MYRWERPLKTAFLNSAGWKYPFLSYIFFNTEKVVIWVMFCFLLDDIAALRLQIALSFTFTSFWDVFFLTGINDGPFGYLRTS